MKNKFMNRINARRFVLILGLIFVLTQVFSVNALAQKRKSKVSAKTSAKKIAAPKTKTSSTAAQGLPLPRVTQVNAVSFKNLLKRDAANAKPLLVNFWATWCDPCREEFPDLVKINADYKDKIDFIVVSLDDLAEIKRDVPKFLIEMKAEMPAYLLKTEDNQATVASISKDWRDALPFTILFNENGEIVYNRQGKVELEKLRTAIDKLLSNNAAK